MGGIWFGVCWRSVAVWLCRCGVFMQSEARSNKLKTTNDISTIMAVLDQIINFFFSYVYGAVHHLDS